MSVVVIPEMRRIRFIAGIGYYTKGIQRYQFGMQMQWFQVQIQPVIQFQAVSRRAKIGWQNVMLTFERTAEIFFGLKAVLESQFRNKAVLCLKLPDDFADAALANVFRRRQRSKLLEYTQKMVLGIAGSAGNIRIADRLPKLVFYVIDRALHRFSPFHFLTSTVS